MGWEFFQELLHARPEDMPRLWVRARSKFREDMEVTAAPKLYSAEDIKQAALHGSLPETKSAIEGELDIMTLIDQGEIVQ